MSEIRTPRHRVLNATDLELKITGWRMAQAIRSYPTNPTPLTRQRWNHGLGREIWRAVDGIGLAAAAAIGIGRYEVVPASVEYMLVKCNWKGLAVMVDIDQLDHREINDCRDGEDNYSENSLRGECWWLWPDNATKDFNPPSWWAYPTAEVVRPLSIHVTDISRMAMVGRSIGHISTNQQRQVSEHAAREEEYAEQIANALAQGRGGSGGESIAGPR